MPDTLSRKIYRDLFSDDQWDLIYSMAGHALDNDDYGWEIEGEVDWALNGYFKDNITAQTGIKIIYDTPKYSSRIFNLS